ncbi:WD40 repeat domain-containing serine/threonine protein kinase [Streptomyces cyaneofuscatus]|uniref:WD40 repeat domain-containing serine/threonine protein kinase n=1 Tax=Streptomyces cyaneofuscatus TaxID=66883 RepID=UPI00365E883D
MTLQTGDPERLGDYWLAARLGAGSQGVVYEAYNGAGTRVALKVVHYDASSFVRDRFVKELDSARRVASFCTAKILDSETQGERPYIVSEYIPGSTLGALLRDRGPLPADETTRLAVGVATALTAIHQAGVVHRDLKPGNVLIGPDGPRIIDFGIARTAEMSLTATGALMGTYGYMAPEVLSGRRATTASDVFAWGALILYCAGGEEPFRGSNLAEVALRTATVDPDLSAVPAQLRPLVAAALAKEPERRPSASEVLQGLIGKMPPSADPRLALLEAGARASELSDASALDGTQPDLDLGERAEQAYAALPNDYHLAVQTLLMRLVVPGSAPDGSQDSVRTAAPEELFGEDLNGEAPAIRTVVAALVDAGVLVEGGDGSVRPTSIALLPAWPRLRNWVQQDRGRLALRNRLGEAALAWDRGGRRGDDLYHGSVLRVSLDWSATAAAYLRPNALESQFLAASRMAAARSVRRRRQLLSALSVLVVTALVAGLFAVQQSREARQQQERATARSTAQAAESLRASDPVNAMLLSLAAWRISPTEEARASLLAAAVQREVDVFQVPHGVRDLEVSTQLLSADGRLIVLNVFGKSQIWDLQKKRKLLSLDQVKGMRDTFVEDISDHSRYALISWADGHGQGLNLVTGAPTGPRMMLGDGAKTISDRGQIVISTDDENGGYEIRDAVTGRTTMTEDLSFHAELSPDGSLLARCDPYPSVSLQRLSGDKRTRIHLDEPPGGPKVDCFGSGRTRMRFSPDGGRLMAGDAATLWVWDTETGDLVTEMHLENPLEGQQPEIRGLVFSTDGRHLIGYSDTDGLLIWRVGLDHGAIYNFDRRDLYGTDTDGGSVTFALDAKGKELVVASRNGSQVQVLDMSRAIAPDPLALPVGLPLVTMSPNGEYGVVHIGEPGAARQVYSMRSGELIGAKIPQRTGELDLTLTVGDTQALSNDGRLLAFEDSQAGQPSDRNVVVYDVRKGRELLREKVSARENILNSVALSSDGAHVAVWTGKTVDGMAVQVWDVSRGGPPQRFVGAQGQLVFSPDGRTLVTTRGQVLDLASGDVKAVALGSTNLTGAAFSADGRTLATTTAEGWVELRDTGTWRLVGRMPSSVTQGASHYGEQLSMPTFTPDGDLLAARVGFGSVQLWDLSSRITLGDALQLGGDTLLSLRFDDQGVLRMIGNGHRRRAFNPEAGAAIKQICRRAGRDITPAVWRTYIPGAPYRKVCA